MVGVGTGTGRGVGASSGNGAVVAADTETGVGSNSVDVEVGTVPETGVIVGSNSAVNAGTAVAVREDGRASVEISGMAVAGAETGS
jgi:hypothetical protein